MSDSHVRRAELLADLGRYDEAAAELAGADPTDVAAHTLLARVKLAAGEPKAALAAADAAVAADPADLDALIARGMVLADLGRVDEAAAQAEQILRHGTGSGYAYTSAAAILAAVRNGRAALDAAWEGVRLTPDQARAHLVLGVVAARLGMEDIARRAYREALALDPRLPVAQAALGVVRLEQHRYARALSHLSTPPRPAPPAVPAPAPAPRSPAGPPADGPAARLRRALRFGAGYALTAPLVAAWAHLIGVGPGVVSVLLGVLGCTGLGVSWARSGVARAGLVRLLRTRKAVPLAVGGVVASPVLLVLSAAVGDPWPLAAAVAAGLVGLLMVPRIAG